MTDFNAALDDHRLAALRADVAVTDDDEVGEIGIRNVAVAREVDVLEMVVVLVRADDAALRALERLVTDDADRGIGRLDGSDGTRVRAGGLEDRLEIGELELLHVEEVLELDVVDVAVARDADHHGLAVGVVDERLHERAARHAHELRDLLDRLGIRRMDLFVGRTVGVATRSNLALRLLEVRGIAARLAKRDAVFTRLGENVELVRELAANVARVGFDRIGLESAAREHALVGLEHRHVALVGRFHRRVEGIGVLHQELLRAHQAEARTDLVTELPLDLIGRDGELTVGVDDVADHFGDRLLGGRRHRIVVLRAILHAEHARTHRLPTA